MSINKFSALLVVFLIIACSAASAKPFEIRGMKGLWWDGIEKYELALPWMAEHDMNFLMTCYTMFPANAMDWRNDHSDEEMEHLRGLVSRGNELGIEICYGFNPGIWSAPPLVYSSDEDIEISIERIKAVHSLGIRWIALCLDDIHRGLQPEDDERFGTLEAAQVYYVNSVWDGVKDLRPRPKIIFCPSAYTTDDMLNHQDYIKTIGKEIHRDILMFWTGPTVCSASITAEDAELVAQWLRRKPFIWDNYPVNDMFPWRPLLAPIKNRSADLAGAVSGYVANPMKQWHISKIPVATIAEYLNNPSGYDPEAAIERVIRSYPADQQRAIRLLVDLYGSSFWGESGFPPTPKVEDIKEARKVLPKYRVLRNELSSAPALSDIWEDVRETLEADIIALQIAATDRRLESPLKASGFHFSGGAADQFGRIKFNRPVNYIYAQPTGKHEMRAEFYVSALPDSSAMLKISGLGDNFNTNPKIEIRWNELVIYQNQANFSHADFETKEYEIPAGAAIKIGVNELFIRNIEEEGTLGMPPWFMVTEAELVFNQ